MTEREFDQWWKAHRAAFLSIDAWLGKLPTDAERRAGNSQRLRRSEIPETEVTQGDVMRTWRATLADVPLVDALSATAKMARGDIETPRDWESHARVVRKNVTTPESGAQTTFKPKGKFRDGEWTYSCPKCEEQGFLEIWSKQSVEAAEKDPETFLKTRKGKYHCQVACACAEGERVVQRFNKRKQFIAVYDERRMYLYHPGDDAAQRLVDEIFAASVSRGTEWDGSGEYMGGSDDF